MRIVGESPPIDCQQVSSQIRVSEELDVEFAEQAIQFGWGLSGPHILYRWKAHWSLPAGLVAGWPSSGRRGSYQSTRRSARRVTENIGASWRPGLSNLREYKPAVACIACNISTSLFRIPPSKLLISSILLNRPIAGPGLGVALIDFELERQRGQWPRPSKGMAH